MNNDEDDKATVVLNINELKKLKEHQEIPAEAVDIEFTQPDEIKESKISIILFDHKSSFFKDNFETFPKDQDIKIIDDLQKLNKEISSNEQRVVVFNYNTAPKDVNQLCAQIKERFKKVKTIIVAKGLSQEKAKLHQESKSGANAYITFPFTTEQIREGFKKVI